MKDLSPIAWALRPLKRYADFSGRSSRAEFWWFVLAVIVALIVGTVVDSILGLGHVFLMYGPLTLLIALATLVPNVAVQVRRLHDRNQPGWWLLGFYGPYVLMLILMPSLRGGAPAAPTAISAIFGLIVLVVAIVLTTPRPLPTSLRCSPVPTPLTEPWCWDVSPATSRRPPRSPRTS